ncbi:MAG: tRNA (guanosine(46)-N7)-methyltransferase TrmB [Pelagibacteraceae bacterium]
MKKKSLIKFLKNKKIKKDFFYKNKKIIIEIGCGTGENLLHLARKYPKNKIIGIEPFKNGLANIAHRCLEEKIKNVYLFPNIFEQFSKLYKNYKFNKCFIFFPDPWPKKRHHKRRLINHYFINEILRHCSSRGSIFFGTDNVHYFEEVKKIVKKIKKIDYKILKKTPTIQTKYHKRALKLQNNVNFLKIDKTSIIV